MKWQLTINNIKSNVCLTKKLAPIRSEPVPEIPCVVTFCNSATRKVKQANRTDKKTFATTCFLLAFRQEHFQHRQMQAQQRICKSRASPWFLRIRGLRLIQLYEALPKILRVNMNMSYTPLISNVVGHQLQTFLTDGKMKGFPVSSRYAPTPRFIFFGFVSFLKASVTPRIASGGPISTFGHHELQR